MGSGRTLLAEMADRFSGLGRERSFCSVSGSVVSQTGGSIWISGLSRLARIGDRVRVEAVGPGIACEVIGLAERQIQVVPYDRSPAVAIGARAFLLPPALIAPHRSWLGRTLDAQCRPIDGKGPLREGADSLSVAAAPPPAFGRNRATGFVRTGIRSIDAFTPLCRGQRIGIFAGSGVGKSTLLAMIAGSSGFDTTVIALVGERGREVREFVEDTLGSAADKAVTIVSTSDESPLIRRLAPLAAMRVAEYFRDLGQSVLLVVDSITRYAHALREVALMTGEPPVARGYTPSVFSELPRLLERAGPGLPGSGSITGVFSVLVDGDDHNDPVADNIRGTLDGHLVLDRAIADTGRYPAINLLGSISRLAQHCWSPEQRQMVLHLKALIARYEDTRDLRLMGGYRAGSDALLDQAITVVPKLYAFVSQSSADPLSFDVFKDLSGLLQGAA